MNRIWMRLASICLSVLLAAHVDAAMIKHQKSVSISTSHSLWKPSNPAAFSGETFCFNAEDNQCSHGSCSQSLLCTFDSGKTIVPTTVSLPYCGSHGVMIDGELFCANEYLPSSNNKTINYSVVSFSPKSAKLSGTLVVEKQFQFAIAKAATSLTGCTLQFSGNGLFLSEEGVHVLPVVAVRKSGTKIPVFFQSRNGFLWKYVSALPFTTEVKSLHTVQLGSGKIAVVAEGENGFQKVTSGYLGKWWSKVMPLNSTAPPFSIMSPSGLLLEYGATNGTSLSAEYHADINPKLGRRSLSLTGRAEKVPSSKLAGTEASSSYAVAYQPTPDRLIVIHDGTDARGAKELRLSTLSVDDSEEKKLLEEKRESEAKKKAEEEAVREKLRKERQEREVRERREKHRRERERRRVFEEQDTDNIVQARKNMGVDGEFIVVRPTHKGTLDLERSTFFW